MAPIEDKLLKDLRDIGPRDADVPFVSTVTGGVMPGSRLDAGYEIRVNWLTGRVEVVPRDSITN